MIDSTIVRAHQHAAGARKVKGGGCPGPWAEQLEAPAMRSIGGELRRGSRGGLSTNIHAAGDALGNPVRLIATPGQRNDTAFAHELVEGFEADAVLTDKSLPWT